MKLLDLTIENYGVYTARHFDFSGPGFRLIYGPNEAGKSTLLQLIREVLFGFPHVSPYVFENHTGKLAATLRMEMRSGRRVRFRRQKGTKNTVTGEIEDVRQPINDEMLNDLLGRAGGELFEHVFGISLTELSVGEKSLQHANLTEALYGSGVGGLAGFQQLQRSLRDEHAALFSPRGRKPPINQLLTSIAEKSRLLRESTTQPREYTALQEEFEACNRDAEKLAEQLEELRREDRRLERLSSALDAWSRREAFREEIAGLVNSERLPLDASRRFQQARERRHECERELERLETELALLPDALLPDAKLSDAQLSDAKLSDAKLSKSNATPGATTLEAETLEATTPDGGTPIEPAADVARPGAVNEALARSLAEGPTPPSSGGGYAAVSVGPMMTPSA